MIVIVKKEKEKPKVYNFNSEHEAKEFYEGIRDYHAKELVKDMKQSIILYGTNNVNKLLFAV